MFVFAIETGKRESAGQGGGYTHYAIHNDDAYGSGKYPPLFMNAADAIDAVANKTYNKFGHEQRVVRLEVQDVEDS